MRLVAEREHACDEAVLQAGGEPSVYAEGILSVCRFYAESQLGCASGMSGSDLKCRVVTDRPVARLSTSRKLLLASIALATVVGPVSVGIANGPPVAEQSPFVGDINAPITPFEVVSVRPDHSGQGFNSRLTVDRFVMERWRVKDLLEYAFDLKELQVVGVPKWIDSERYNIDGKVADTDVAKEENMSQEERLSLMRLRVQNLLADRFKLRVHHFLKNSPVLALVVARNGPKFSAVKTAPIAGGDTGQPPVSLTMEGNQWVLSLDHAPLRYVILMLGGQPEMGGRILVDNTQLKGDYKLLGYAPGGAAQAGLIRRSRTKLQTSP